MRGQRPEATDNLLKMSTPLASVILLTGAAIILAFLALAPRASANGKVDVTVTGSGSGMITSTAEQFIFGNPQTTQPTVGPAHLNCMKSGGPICSAVFQNNAGFGETEVRVQLTATPVSGSIFLGWTQTGASDSQRCTTPPQSKPTCELTLLGDPGPNVVVTAEFLLLPDLPIAITDGVNSGGANHLMILEGRVNPNNYEVSDCRFVYGKTTEYGQSTPCVPSAAGLGVGNNLVTVTASTGPLEPNTTYHFRLRASNLGGTAQGKDRSFQTGHLPITSAPAGNCPNETIRGAQGIEVLLLPSCMALEQVSPPNKGNQPARLPNLSAVGNRVVFNSIAALGATPNSNGIGGDLFIATRGSSGWDTTGINPPRPLLGTPQPSFSSDLTYWFRAIDTPEGTKFFRGSINGSQQPVTPILTNLTTTTSPTFLGASMDGTHLYLQPDFGIIPRTGSYLSGDPQPSGEGEDSNVYVAKLDAGGNPSLSLLARDRDGKVWGGNCGARLGGIEQTVGALNLNLENGKRSQGAVSSDGSRVYFSTRPDQPTTGDCLAASEKRILIRTESTSGPVIEPLFQSECSRISPPCSTDRGDDVFQGASLDQTRVYFTSNRQLANTDLDGDGASCQHDEAVLGCDLYLYDATRPSGQRLIQVSAGNNSAPSEGSGASLHNAITAISADGSHVYFVAESVLTTAANSQGDTAHGGEHNLYLYKYPQQQTSFIGTLHSEDGGSFQKEFLFGREGTWRNDAYPVPIKGTSGQSLETGGDGHILFFRSKAPLTTDDTDSSRDIYRYDAQTEVLTLISQAEPGGIDNGPFDAVASFGAVSTSSAPGTNYAEWGRRVSEDGQTIVFTTREPLVLGDVNDAEDAYMWRNGKLFHLPGSTSTVNGPRNEPAISHDGSTVVYQSSRQLLPTDGDSTFDIYVARVNGGFQPSPLDPNCSGEACLGPRGETPSPIGANSIGFSGYGNVRAPRRPKPCSKGKRKAKGKRKGKTRCVRHTRTNRNHGGRK